MAKADCEFGLKHIITSKRFLPQMDYGHPKMYGVVFLDIIVDDEMHLRSNRFLWLVSPGCGGHRGLKGVTSKISMNPSLGVSSISSKHCDLKSRKSIHICGRICYQEFNLEDLRFCVYDAISSAVRGVRDTWLRNWRPRPALSPENPRIVQIIELGHESKYKSVVLVVLIGRLGY